MSPNVPDRDAPPRAMRSPIASAALLLGFYIVMYLAMGAAVRMIDPVGAAGMASDRPAQCVAD